MQLAFDELVSFVRQIPAAVNLNKREREDFRNTIAGFKDELDKGLTLVIHRIKGGINIAESGEKGRKQKLIDYHNDTPMKLMETFSEFKICQGLRNKRDHLEQLLNPAKFAIRVSKTSEVKGLLSALQSDEYVILEEVSDAMTELDTAARKKPLKDYVVTAERHVENIRKRQKQIERKSRRLFDVH
jgi:hypothetical protein